MRWRRNANNSATWVGEEAAVPSRTWPGDRQSALFAFRMTPTPDERLELPDAFLSRTDLRELGLERRAVDAVFRAVPVVSLPGYSRPLIRVADYRALIEASTYRGDRVRPT